MWVQKIGGGGVCGLAYAPDGRTLYTRDYGGFVTAWDVAARAGKRLFKLTTNERYATHGLHAVGRFLVVDVNGRARVWDVAAGAERPDVPGYRSGFAPDAVAGASVRFISADRRGIDAHDPAAGETARLFTAPTEAGDLLSADVSPDGRTAAVVCADRRALLTDAGGSWTALDRPFDGRVRFLPDGRLAWTAHGRVQIWDAAPPSARVDVACFMTSWVFAVSPAAPVFVALNPDRQLTLFSLDTGAPLRSLDFALGKYVMCAAFSPDGLTCAVGGTNKQFAVFDVDI